MTLRLESFNNHFSPLLQLLSFSIALDNLYGSLRCIKKRAEVPAKDIHRNNRKDNLPVLIICTSTHV